MNNWRKIWLTLISYSLALFFVVWVKVQFVRTGYRISELKTKQRTMQLELAQAQVEWTRFISLPTLENKAKLFNFRLPSQYSLTQIRYLSP